MLKFINSIKEGLTLIKDMCKKLKVMAENLKEINEVIDSISKLQTKNFTNIERGIHSILSHLIADKTKEEFVRYYAQFLGKDVTLATEEKEFRSVIVKCGVLETFEKTPQGVLKIMKPFVAGKEGGMFFAYPKDLVKIYIHDEAEDREGVEDDE